MAVSEKGIAPQELLPIVFAAMIWGPRWKDDVVVMHCDNLAVVSVVNSGYSKDKDIMHMLRCLFFILAFWGFHLRSVHIPGLDNTAADAISRDKLSSFFQVCPHADRQASPIPPPLIDRLVAQQPDWTSPSWAALFGSFLQQVWRTPCSEPTIPERSDTLSSAPPPVYPLPSY